MSLLDREMLAVIVVILIVGLVGLMRAWDEREETRISRKPLPPDSMIHARPWSDETHKDVAPPTPNEQEPALLYALLYNWVVSIVQQELRREREGEPHFR
jgi:hypothetical protein